MPEVIALISGKGGSGKTTVSLALAHLAASLDIDTLLIDGDFGTHGLTYFFIDQITSTAPIGTDAKDDLWGLFKIRDNLHFFPSTSRTKTSATQASELVNHVLRDIHTDPAPFQLVIVDCQAGISEGTRIALKSSNSALVVTEADPISIWAVNDFLSELGDDLPRRVLGLVNKAMKEEEPYFQALVDITQRIRFIEQLPHDLSVRRAFFRRSIPIDLDNPSPFIQTLAASFQSIVQLTEAQSALKQWSTEQAKRRLHEELARLVSFQETSNRRTKAQRLAGILPAIAVALTGAVAGSAFAFDSSAFPITVATLGAVAAFAALLFSVNDILSRSLRTSTDEERDILVRMATIQTALDALESEP